MNDEALELAERLFAAIQAADVDAVKAIYTDDTIVWHNFDQVEQPAADNLRVLRWMGRTVQDLRYEDVRRQPTPTGFVQQHILRGTAPNGEALEIPAVIIGTVENGRVTRIDEYLDSAQTAALRA